MKKLLALSAVAAVAGIAKFTQALWDCGIRTLDQNQSYLVIQ